MASDSGQKLHFNTALMHSGESHRTESTWGAIYESARAAKVIKLETINKPDAFRGSAPKEDS